MNGSPLISTPLNQDGSCSENPTSRSRSSPRIPRRSLVDLGIQFADQSHQGPSIKRIAFAENTLILISSGGMRKTHRRPSGCSESLASKVWQAGEPSAESHGKTTRATNQFWAGMAAWPVGWGCSVKRGASWGTILQSQCQISPIQSTPQRHYGIFQ
jgi:hypothetical protein